MTTPASLFSYQTLMSIGLVIGGVVYVTTTLRRGYTEVLERTSQGWRSLAEQKTTEVAELQEQRAAEVTKFEAQLSKMRDEITQMRGQYDNLKDLYIQSETENSALKARVASLEQQLKLQHTTHGPAAPPLSRRRTATDRAA